METITVAVPAAVTGAFALLDRDDAPLCDLALACEDGIVPAFLSVFAAHSALVQREGMESSARPLQIDVRPSTCAAARLVRTFAYTGELEVSSQECAAVCALAERLGLAALAASAEGAASTRFVSAETACAYFQVGRRGGRTALEMTARAYIQANTAACVGTDGWFELDTAALLSLLQEDNLSIREEDLFRQCLAWADVRSGDGGATGAGRKTAKKALLDVIVPHLRFPTMGAHVFARTVVPTGALHGEDANTVLMHFIAPDMARPLLKFRTDLRTGSGSVYTWAAGAASQSGVMSLSKDRRIAEFGSPALGSGAPATHLVSGQAFAAGLATVFISTWGCASATVGVVVSDDSHDDGDCATMAALAASPSSASFEGVMLRAGEGASPVLHRARYEPARSLLASSAAHLRDGSCIVLTLDWDVHVLGVGLWHRGENAPVHVGSLRDIPALPLRLTLTATSVRNGGDVEGIAVIASRPPTQLSSPIAALVQAAATAISAAPAAASVPAPAPAPVAPAPVAVDAEPVIPVAVEIVTAAEVEVASEASAVAVVAPAADEGSLSAQKAAAAALLMVQEADAQLAKEMEELRATLSQAVEGGLDGHAAGSGSEEVAKVGTVMDMD